MALGKINVGGGKKLVGNATTDDVLSGKTFSNATSNTLVGTMPNIGTLGMQLTINGTFTIPKGYHSGEGFVYQDIPVKTAATYNPSTSAQTISAGQYLSGVQTIAATTGTAAVGDVLTGKTFNSANGIGITGTMANKGAITGSVGVGGTYSSTQNGYVTTISVTGPTLTGDAAVANVLAGKTFYSNSGTKQTGTLTSRATYTEAGTSYRVWSSNQLYLGLPTGAYVAESASAGAGNTEIVVKQAALAAADSNLVSTNIRAGSTIFGVAGNSQIVNTVSGDVVASDILSGKKAYSKGALVTGTMPIYNADIYRPFNSDYSNSMEIGIEIPTGFYDTSAIIWLSEDNFISDNIRANTNIFGMTGTYTSDATATAAQMLSGKTAYVNGNKVTGTLNPKLHNMVAFGSFDGNGAGNLSGNAYVSYNTSYKKFGTSSLKITCPSGSSEITVPTSYMNTLANHKYYLSCWMYSSSVGASAQLYARIAEPSVTDTIKTANTWQLISGIITFSTPAESEGRIDNNTQNTTIYYDGFMCLDLTEYFGAGKEPTKDEMDAIVIANGGWWETNDNSIKAFADPTYSYGLSNVLLSGSTAFANGVKITGTMKDRSAENIHQTTLEVQNGIYTPNNGNMRTYYRPPEGYYNGYTWVAADNPNLQPENIKSGVNILGIVGTAPEPYFDYAVTYDFTTTIANGPGSAKTDPSNNNVVRWVKFQPNNGNYLAVCYDSFSGYNGHTIEFYYRRGNTFVYSGYVDIPTTTEGKLTDIEWLDEQNLMYVCHSTGKDVVVTNYNISSGQHTVIITLPAMSNYTALKTSPNLNYVAVVATKSIYSDTGGTYIYKRVSGGIQMSLVYSKSFVNYIVPTYPSWSSDGRFFFVPMTGTSDNSYYRMIMQFKINDSGNIEYRSHNFGAPETGLGREIKGITFPRRSSGLCVIYENNYMCTYIFDKTSNTFTLKGTIDTSYGISSTNKEWEVRMVGSGGIIVMASRNDVPYNQCMYKVNPDLSMTLIGSLIGGGSAYGTCIDIDPSNRWVAIGSKSGGTRCVLLNGSTYDHNALYASNYDSVFYKPRVAYYDAINNDIEYQGNRYRLIDSNYGDSLYRSNH